MHMSYRLYNSLDCITQKSYNFLYKHKSKISEKEAGFAFSSVIKGKNWRW